MWLQANERGTINVISAQKKPTPTGPVWDDGLVARFEPNMAAPRRSIGPAGTAGYPQGTRFVAFVEDIHADEVRKSKHFGSLFREIDAIEANPPALVPGAGQPPKDTYTAGDFALLLQREKGMKVKASMAEVTKHADIAIEHAGALFYPKERVLQILKQTAK